MDPTLVEAMDRLRKAHNALRSEMAVWALPEAAIDTGRLRSLWQMAQSFREQAHSLLVMMLYQDTPEAVQQEVEAMIMAFGDLEAQIKAMLAPEPRGS